MNAMDSGWKEWSLVGKGLQYLTDVIWGESGSEKPESQLHDQRFYDQKFTEIEVRMANLELSNNSALSESLGISPEVRSKIKDILGLLNSLIDDQILKSHSIEGLEGNENKKLEILVKLVSTDDKEATLKQVFRLDDHDPKDTSRRLTEFSKFIHEVNSAIEPIDPLYTPPVPKSRLDEMLKGSSCFQKLSDCLFDTLVHLGVCCESEDSPHFAKLDLHALCNQEKISNPSFDIFLCSCRGREPHTWHELTCVFNSELKQYPSSDLFKDSHLCKLMHYCGQHRGLDIQFAGGPETPTQLCGLNRRPQTSGPVLPILSLASLIDNDKILVGGDLYPKDKAALSLTLAVSLLLLSRDKWLHADWRAENIFFCGEDSVTEDFNHPYLQTQLAFSATPEVQTNEPEFSNPYFLSFALLLLQLYVGKRIEMSNNKSSLGPSLFFAIDAFLTPKFRRQLQDVAPGLEDAIEACLSSKIQIGVAVGNDEDAKTREFVYRMIVKPLEKNVARLDQPMIDRRHRKVDVATKTHRSKRQISKGKHERADIKDNISDSEHERTELAKQGIGEAGHDSGAKSRIIAFHKKVKFQAASNVEAAMGSESAEDESGTESAASLVESDDVEICDISGTAMLYDDQETSGPKTIASAIKFWAHINQFNYRMITPLKLRETKNSRNVRVAVIDSGCSKSDRYIKGSKRVIKGKSWVGENPDDWDDTYGHGTHVIRFLLQAAPSAELYIAKITQDKEIPHDEIHVIKEAINWAVDCDVDIISMSLGLEEEDEDVNDALDRAINPEDHGSDKSPKIVFAAAANGGANADTAYPARRDGVICVYASDGDGNTGGFNPDCTREATDMDGFAILGVDIESKWNKQKVHKSGTSFATPIAAGIACNILEFARHELPNMSAQRRHWLYSYKGIMHTFRRMSRKRGDYYYLSPWRKHKQEIRRQRETGVWEGREYRKVDSEYLKKLLVGAIQYA